MEIGPLKEFRWAVSLLLLLMLMASVVQAQIAENNPRLSMPNSRLNRPYDAPVFITGHLGFGGSFQYGHGQLNYGGSFIFRPGSSANFFDFLQKLNSAMVLQLDYQELAPESRMFSGDLILRRYLAEGGGDGAEVLPFLGLGICATDVIMPAGSGIGNSRYWSWLMEAGQEWYFKPDFVLVGRAQYRHFSYGEAFVSSWTVSVAVGIPVPW